MGGTRSHAPVKGDEKAGGWEMLCRRLMALWLLVCLAKHDAWHFPGIVCDHLEILGRSLKGASASLFSSIVFILFPLTFKECVPSSSRILEATEILVLP